MVPQAHHDGLSKGAASMNFLNALRQRLGWKIFLANLVIVLVGVIVLAGTAELHAPTALARHTARMEALLGDNPTLVADLHDNFMAAVNEILTVAALAALLAAALISSFVARRIVGPVRQMMRASQRMAAGDYHERVQVPGEDELGALAQSFNRMAETLEQTEQRRLALIGNVAHELRTPLTSIRGIMEGLVDGVLPAEPATFLGVQREVSRLQRLVHDLEELSRAEAGQIPLEFRPVAPADLIRAAAERLQPQFDDKGVNLNLETPDNLPSVQADAGRITQVLLNLMGNALQYTPPGGRVSIQLSVISDQSPAISGQWSVVSNQTGADDKLITDNRSLTTDHWLLITVKDTGIGIPPEHLPHIFERFYRVDKSRS
ncbi:MAG: sensor histidine kinase, partial [Anaerolineae bacterium]